MTIYEYKLEFVDLQEVMIPDGSTILSVQSQGGNICFWAIVEPSLPLVTKKFRIFGTGHPMNEVPNIFIGTVQQGPFVWHIFEE